jgi:signal transduction histidine kinase
MSRVNRLDRFLPESLRAPTADADQRRRARVVAGFALILACFALLLPAGAAVMGLWSNAAVTLGGLPIAILLLRCLRRGMSLPLLGVAIGVTLFASAFQGSIALGGIGAPPLRWLCVIPLIVILVSGPRYGLYSALVGLATTATFYAIGSFDGAPITPSLHFFDGVALLMFVVALALVFENFKRRALSELAAVNARLAAEMRERERIEADLRLAQKLESVGRLAAGIAHEIATPVQFVRDTTAFTTGAVSDVLLVLERHREVTRAVLADADARPAATAALAADDEHDVAYAVEELPPSVARMTDGLERIGAIVRSMRQLVHPMQQELAEVDLDAEIANTLALAINEYREVADLATQFGDVPRVMCRASEINQVVLNLVINASHAIRDTVVGTRTRGTLTVATRRDGDMVEIAVTDSGGGIPDTIRDKIFDPFFTTKAVGVGTGQGLAIARSAIERHGGTLTFETHLGVGTTFRARLPLVAIASAA